MKTIKPNIRITDSGKYYVVIKGFQKTYETLEEAENVLKEIKMNTKNINHDYPLDFIDALFGTNKMIDIAYIENNFDKNINYVLDTITEREALVVRKRFIEGYTFEAVALQFGVSRERIRQIEAKAIRKLRHPSRLYFIRYGEEVKELQDDINKLTNDLLLKKEQLLNILANPDLIELTKEEIEGATSIDTLDFSVRTYHVLRRSGVDTLLQLMSKSVKQLRVIRNMGNKSIREIIEKLGKIGFKLSE